jgi:hypothetical protein
MSSTHVEYLEELERTSLSQNLDQFYLWPRTPIKGDMQEEMLQRVGVSDFEAERRRSRPSQIMRLIKVLLNDRLIAEDFSIVDFPCGDAIVLWQIKKVFPRANCYGLDCNKGTFATHDMVQRHGVLLFRGFLQQLFASNPEESFDIAVMLNTYRGWESADLREHERDLPELADAWFARNAKFTILTATDGQISRLRDLGFSVISIGKGEDDSKMICISTSGLPTLGFRRLLRVFKM